MKMFKEGFKWFVAVLAIAAIPSVSALADPPTATPKASPPQPSHIPPVPRSIPDLVPYWNFDPPKSSLFDLNKLTVSGDLRVRPEWRTNGAFGLNPGAPGTSASRKQNDFVVQQWMRFGLNYAVSSDVDVFFQPQYAKNWGAGASAPANGACPVAICANDAFHVGQGDTLFVRQAYVLIRDAGIKNFDLKLGRQLLVFGNHRLFGHFDWANTGFSHDAITFNYTGEKWNVTGGWAKSQEGDFNSGPAAGNPDMFPLAVPGVDGASGAGFSTDASDDADFVFLRGVVKPMKGLSLEPMWVLFWNSNGSPGTLGSTTQAHAPNQNRHTLGGRAAYKAPMGAMTLDATGEFYWQTGSMGVRPGNSPRELSINAWAAAIFGGVTLNNMPMKPRFGLEFNGASGDGDANACGGANGTGGGGTVADCNGTANTFENLYPTNHILMGYMDLFAWRNMIGYSANAKLKPTPESHVEIAGWIFRRQNSGDNWYRAAQNVYFAHIPGTTTSSSLGQELDIIYTHFFKQGKVGFQLGYGHFFAGEFLEQFGAGNAAGQPVGGGLKPTDQDWVYTQVHVNF